MKEEIKINNIQNAKKELNSSLIKQKKLEEIKQERNYINCISSNNNNFINISRSNTKYGVITEWSI